MVIIVKDEIIFTKKYMFFLYLVYNFMSEWWLYNVMQEMDDAGT